MPDFYRPYLTGLYHNKETRCVHGVSMSKRRVYSFQFLKKFDSESSFTLLPVVTSLKNVYSRALLGGFVAFDLFVFNQQVIRVFMCSGYDLRHPDPDIHRHTDKQHRDQLI